VIPYFGSLLISKEGVYLFIFVSGAMLEFNKKNLSNLTSLVSFYIDRLIRVYPAYLVAVVFAACFFSPIVMTNSWWDNINTILAIRAYSNLPVRDIASVGWFIGMIVMLYLLYPFLSRMIDRSPEIWTIALVGFSLTCRAVFWMYNEPGSITYNFWYNNPLRNLAFFVLGIYVIRRGLYPRWTHHSTVITWLSDMTFYIFLIQGPIIVYGVWTQSPLLFVICTMTVGAMLMALDHEIQSRLRGWVNRSLQLDKKIVVKSEFSEKG
jgi:peptidoglycan/LPS O-acetylase OafA/YrhL